MPFAEKSPFRQFPLKAYEIILLFPCYYKKRMCKKNDYERKAITALLAVLTALFALAAMSGSADASPANAVRTNAVAANNVRRKLKINNGARARQTAFRLIVKQRVNSYNILIRL